eukprot:7614558-Ditylum_brightwellii.AAC.1
MEVDAAKLKTETVEEVEDKTLEDNNSFITVGPVVLIGIIPEQISKIQRRVIFPIPLLPTCKVVAHVECTCDKKG